jgi:hypothetical protein
MSCANRRIPGPAGAREGTGDEALAEVKELGEVAFVLWRLNPISHDQLRTRRAGPHAAQPGALTPEQGWDGAVPPMVVDVPNGMSLGEESHGDSMIHTNECLSSESAADGVDSSTASGFARCLRVRPNRQVPRH